MADSGPELTPEEYGRLSDQKAEDWRQISEVNPTLFGVAGAIFVAGVTGEDGKAWVLALSPMPLFLGVFYMIRSAKLQQQMIVYMAVRVPEAAGRWERDIDRLLPPVWRARESGGVVGMLAARSGRVGPIIGFLSRPSAWNTWLAISLGTAVLVNLTSVVADYGGAPLASIVGIVASLVVGGLLTWQASGIRKDKEMWRKAWEADGKNGSIDEIEQAARIARYGK